MSYDMHTRALTPRDLLVRGSVDDTGRYLSIYDLSIERRPRPVPMWATPFSSSRQAIRHRSLRGIRATASLLKARRLAGDLRHATG